MGIKPRASPAFELLNFFFTEIFDVLISVQIIRVTC
jgi:hypothetical protein